MKKAKNFSVLILAAGAGTRMKSETPKVLHPLCGVPIIKRVLNTVRSLKPQSVGVVVGHQADRLKKAIGSLENVQFIDQKAQKGSGHAVQSALPWIKKNLSRSSHLVVLCGDTPLVRAETLKDLIKTQKKLSQSATILSAHFSDPFGYGRIVLDFDGHVKKIVEEKDASFEEKKIQEINSGIYCFDAKKLVRVLPKIKNNNAKKEYYLTDVFELLSQDKDPAGFFRIAIDEHSHLELLGINTRADLATAEKVIQKILLRHWMVEGVTILNPDTTYIGDSVSIGAETVLLPGTMVTGKTKIGKGCVIGPNSYIEDTLIGNRAKVRSSYVYGSQIGDEAQVGPFSHIRPKTVVSKKARVGNFSEIKNSEIGEGTKVSHLSYVGDSTLGSEVNVGAGAITCNFDGKNKHRTVVGSNSFIGSNVNLVAPVKIGAQSIVGAGSTITEDIPVNSLAIERTRQTVKRGWTIKRGKN